MKQKLRNKLLSLGIVLLMVFGLVPGTSIPVKAATGKIGTADYTLENGNLTISDGSFTRQDFWDITKQGMLMGENRSVKSVSFKNAHLTDTGQELFYLFYVLESADLSGLDISGVTNLGGLFYCCQQLKSVVLGGKFNTSGVTQMNAMFTDCNSLNSLDTSKINTSSVTTMQGMFRGCKSLKSIDVSGFDTSHVTNMQEMFSNAGNLKSITFGSKFTTKKVTNMHSMFASCPNLTELNLTSFDMSARPDTGYMFFKCTSLKTIYGSDWVSFIQNDNNKMFENCTALSGGAGTKYSAGNVGKGYARIDGGSAAPGYFTKLLKKVSFTEPQAKTGLIANGRAQALIIAGSATGGTMQYALGNKTAATGTYSAAIPVGTDAGTYYVWYKVKGDADHYDSSPAVITVTIATKKDSPTKQPEKNSPAKKTEKKVSGRIQMNNWLRLYWKGSNVAFRWGKVSGADTYEIWMAYCGSKKLKKVRTVHNVNSIVVKKLGGKKLDQKRNVRAYVIAYRNGTKIGRSLECHSAGPKNRHTNAKKIKTAKNTYKLKVGRAAKLTAKTIKIKSGRPLPGKGHCARFRYASSDNHVATVSKGGKIRAVGAGKCNVWVYAQNGISRKVTVIVQ